MKIGGSTLFDPSDVVGSVKKLIELDIHHVEICPVFQAPRENVTLLRELAKDYGVSYSVHAPLLCDDLSNRDPRLRKVYQDNVIDSAIFATEIEASHLNVHPGYTIFETIFPQTEGFSKLKLPRKRYLQLAVASLSEILSHCERHNLRLSIENLSYENWHLGTSPEEMALIFSQLSPSVGLTLDLGHAHITENIPEYLTHLSKRLLSVHISNNNGKEDQHKGIEDGNIDIDYILRRLKEINYWGNLILELYTLDDIRDSKKSLERRLKYLFDKE